MMVSRERQPSFNTSSLFYGDQTVLEEIVHEALGSSTKWNWLKLYNSLMSLSYLLMGVSLCLLIVSLLLYIFVGTKNQEAWRDAQRKQKQGYVEMVNNNPQPVN